MITLRIKRNEFEIDYFFQTRKKRFASFLWWWEEKAGEQSRVWSKKFDQTVNIRKRPTTWLRSSMTNQLEKDFIVFLSCRPNQLRKAVPIYAFEYVEGEKNGQPAVHDQIRSWSITEITKPITRLQDVIESIKLMNTFLWTWKEFFYTRKLFGQISSKLCHAIAFRTFAMPVTKNLKKID